MPQNNGVKTSYYVEEIFHEVIVKEIYKEILDNRKCVKEDMFTYAPIERTAGGKTYTITARHIPMKEAMSFAKSSCRDCYGTGKRVLLLDKNKIKNPDEFVVLAPEPILGKTAEQLKTLVEGMKKTKYMKILLPCQCTIKQMHKKGLHVVSNDMTNIMVEVTCTEKIMG
jgi:hypothetical protein